MRMSRQTTVTVVVAAVAAVLLGGLVVRQLATEPDEVEGGERTTVAVRADSHRLDTADDGKVTLVEFLDLECESCAAAYPFVEDLREKYAGRVTFVMRYFPLESHLNSRNAAHAVEAAARQGRLEDMYRRMFETQQQWGESQESQAPLFRTFADELGLDLATYDADVAGEAVAARVQADVDDGLALGVTGTPTFFLNGEKVEAASTDDFVRQIDDALAD
ncbi:MULTISPECIES: thioredoxin domain-containing protein [Aeromicrobium]|uniref:DsbA family protein n=1 Tax=Aeromicrobium TaxID=2040 RepID=UPI000AA31F02|nr:MULTISPECIES: thioredoxin domain-containing protein [Aeromicrobium]MCL8251012.1 DsbA family protein [Aeromicrobium fastidiosum]